jgi:hypothetical protein
MERAGKDQERDDGEDVGRERQELEEEEWKQKKKEKGSPSPLQPPQLGFSSTSCCSTGEFAVTMVTVYG